MTREQLLNELSGVSRLVESRPWWQKGMLDEYSKSTCDTPRPVQLKRTKTSNAVSHDSNNDLGAEKTSGE